MTEHKNGYILADIRLFRSKKTKLIALIAAIAAVLILVLTILPGIQRYGLAEEFIVTLYETTQDDLKDPTTRVERLKELATEELVNELLQNGGIPAVVLHENGKNVTTSFKRESRPLHYEPQPELWTDELPGKVTISDIENDKLLAGWRGVLGVRMEKVKGKWLVTQISDVDWQELYPIT